MRLKSKKISQLILDILFPIECLGCKRVGVWLCQDCLQNIPLNTQFNCPVCRQSCFLGRVCFKCQKKSFLDGVWVASNYDNELLQRIIFCYKYHFVKDLSVYLSDLIVKFLKIIAQQADYLAEIDFITAVPLHKRKFLQRGFNQAEVLAEEINKSFDWPKDIFLKRKRYTSPQVNLKSKVRQINVKGAFCLEEEKDLTGKKIILVDDVFTTGSTLQECAKVLKQAGAREVWGLVLAKG